MGPADLAVYKAVAAAAVSESFKDSIVFRPQAPSGRVSAVFWILQSFLNRHHGIDLRCKSPGFGTFSSGV